MVTSRDVDFIKKELYSVTKIEDVMVPRNRLIVGIKNLTLKEAYTILENEKKGKFNFFFFFDFKEMKLLKEIFIFSQGTKFYLAC